MLGLVFRTTSWSTVPARHLVDFDFFSSLTRRLLVLGRLRTHIDIVSRVGSWSLHRTQNSHALTGLHWPYHVCWWLAQR